MADPDQGAAGPQPPSHVTKPVPSTDAGTAGFSTTASVQGRK